MGRAPVGVLGSSTRACERGVSGTLDILAQCTAGRRRQRTPITDYVRGASRCSTSRLRQVGPPLVLALSFIPICKQHHIAAMLIPINVPQPSFSSASHAPLPPQLARLGSDEIVIVELQGALQVEGDQSGRSWGTLTMDPVSILL